MRILTVSDEIDRLVYSDKAKEVVGDVDLIISCGDLPFHYLDFLVSTFNVPLLYVLGNHDAATDKRKLRVGLPDFEIDYKNPRYFGGINIDQKIVNFNNVLIGGLEGCKRYNYGPHQYTESEMEMKILKMYPQLYLNKLIHGKYIDILVTHAPPFKLGDLEDLPHQGFKAFRKFIKKFKPKYLLHGHIHLYDFRDIRNRPILEYEGTKIINCFKYYILEI